MSNERDAYRVLQVDPGAHEVVVKAAYYALAGLFHPDRDPSAAATQRMAEVNAAYAKIRSRDLRDGYDRLRAMRQGEVTPPVVHAGTAAQPSRTNGSITRDGGPDTLDFGRYAGWSIQQLAASDPDYLLWLSRHSSGIRYRRKIDEVMRRDATQREPAVRPRKGR